MGGEGGRKETIYEGSSGNTRSSQLHCHNPETLQSYPEAFSQTELRVGRWWTEHTFVEYRKNASSAPILMLVSLVKMLLQTRRTQLRTVPHPAPSNASRRWRPKSPQDMAHAAPGPQDCLDVRGGHPQTSHLHHRGSHGERSLSDSEHYSHWRCSACAGIQRQARKGALGSQAAASASVPSQLFSAHFPSPGAAPSPACGTSH